MNRELRRRAKGMIGAKIPEYTFAFCDCSRNRVIISIEFPLNSEIKKITVSEKTLNEAIHCLILDYFEILSLNKIKTKILKTPDYVQYL